eukprot:gene22772-biopygen23540
MPSANYKLARGKTVERVEPVREEPGSPVTTSKARDFWKQAVVKTHKNPESYGSDRGMVSDSRPSKVSFASTASFAPPDPERPTVGQSGLNPLFDKGRSGTASRKTSKWPLASSLLDTRRQTELQPSRSDGEESPENAREVDPFRPSSSGAQGATHGARKGSAASTSTTSTTALTQQSWTDNIVHTFRRLSRSLTTLSSHSNLQTNSELQRAPSKLRTSDWFSSDLPCSTKV